MFDSWIKENCHFEYLISYQKFKIMYEPLKLIEHMEVDRKLIVVIPENIK